MTSDTAKTPARKGDLMAYRMTQRATDSRYHTTETPLWYIGVVSKTDRQGVVQEIRDVYNGVIRRGRYGWPDTVTVLSQVFSQDRIDVEKAMDAARNHKDWTGRRVEPFDSLDEVKALLQPLVKR